MRMPALLVVLLSAAFVACAKQEPPAPAAPATSATATASAIPVATLAPNPAASATTPADPPTEEDFEDEASAKVTPATLDSQLDALEKEIQSD